VVEGVDQPRGKWPAALGNVVILEAQEIPEWLTSGILGVLEPLTSGILEPVTDALGLEDPLLAAEAVIRGFDYDDMRQFAF